MFHLNKDKMRIPLSPELQDLPFVEAGTYPIIREFDETRLVILVNNPTDRKRQVTVIAKALGQVA